LHSKDSAFRCIRCFGIGLVVTGGLVVGQEEGSVAIVKTAAPESASCKGSILHPAPTTYTGVSRPCPKAAMKTSTCVLRLCAPAQNGSGQQRE